MQRTLLAAAVAAAAVLTGAAATAQEAPSISLTPADPPRWDLAGHVGWLHAGTAEAGAFGTDSYTVPSAGITAGGYLTPHVKAEIQTAVSGAGHVYRTETVAVRGAPPLFRSREDFVQTTSVAAGVQYQFFENQWFHPFLGGGVEVMRIRTRSELLPHSIPLPEPVSTTATSYTARPFVGAGFKWYVTERAFLRTALQASFARPGTRSVTWMAGIGGDL